MKLNELLSQMTDKMTGHYSPDTIKSYMNVAANFFHYLHQHPEIQKGDFTRRMESYLTWRVKKFNISPSTQNVDFNALLFVGRQILKIDVGPVNALRAKPRDRVPHILSPAQVASLLTALPEEYQLISKILYGAGLRINECLRLRIKDVDFGTGKLIIHEGKGDKDGIVPIPDTLIEPLRAQISKSLEVWSNDRHHRVEGVYVPHALSRKYRATPTSKDWFWVFPNPSLGRDENGIIRRHHIYEFSVQKAFTFTRRKLKLPEYTSPHTLRHCFATHFLQNLLAQGIPQSMAEEKLIEYLRHASRETLRWYVHLVAPKSAMVRSPLDIIQESALA